MSFNVLKRFKALEINDEITKIEYKETVEKIDSLLIKAQQTSQSLFDKIKYLNGIKQQAVNAGIDISEIKKIEDKLKIIQAKKDEIDKKIIDIINSLNEGKVDE